MIIKSDTALSMNGAALLNRRQSTTTKRVSMIGFNVELLTQLTIIRLNQLADRINPLFGLFCRLLFLVAFGKRKDTDAILTPKFCRLFSMDVGFVADHG